VFDELQGLTMLLSQQKAKLSALIDKYCKLSKMQGPLNDSKIREVDQSTSEICGKFVMKHKNAYVFLQGLDLWVLEKLLTLNQDELQVIVVAVAKMLV
jgi:hypothetical protein